MSIAPVNDARTRSDPPHPGMLFQEFVAFVAALMATNALAIDSMLPALLQIGNSLGVTSPNRCQWIIATFLIGFGVSQIIYGTLADSFGRRRVIICGLSTYVVCSLWAACAHSFELMLMARFLQGAGAAASRVLAVTLVRDCYAGRQMARVMSLVMIVFLGIPVLAPTLGQIILLVAPWRAIFIGLAVFGSAMLFWATLRLPETLHGVDRSPISFGNVGHSFGVILSNRVAMGYTLAMMLIIGSFLGFLNSAPQIFAETFHRPHLFATVFSIVAGFMATASFLNASLVGKFGMRILSHTALVAFVLIASVHLVIALLHWETIWTFTIFQSATMFCFGLISGNFGSISMEPLGSVAGTAASVQGFISTVGAAIIGIVIGQAFNGTDLPLISGFCACGVAAGFLVFVTEPVKFFKSRDSLPDEFMKAGD